MDPILANLKNEVQCSLCSDTLIEPKILKCFHTFCKLCIKRYAELIEDANVFHCPKCSSETSLPDLSSVEDLKPSLIHSRMLKVLEFVESEKVCSVSGSHSRASWHCFDCNRSLCDECEKNHSMFIKDHKMVSLVETKEEDIKLMLSRETNCVHHVDKTVEKFCKDCKQAICMQCLKYGHDEHLTITLAKYTSKKKALMSEQLEELKLREQEMEKQVQKIEEENNELKANCEKDKLKVKERLREMFDMLQQNALELLSQIDDEIVKSEKRKVRGQSVLDQTRGAIDYMNKVITNGITNEVIENQDLKDTCFNSVENVVSKNSEISFVVNEELKKQVKSGLGTIRVTQPSDHKTSSINIPSKLEALKKEKLIVVTKTKAGNLNNNSSDVIDVKIIPENNVKIEQKSARKQGRMEVDFIAKVSGKLTAEVKVNGNHVLNSPLVMNVKPQQMRITRKFNMEKVNKGPPSLSGIAVNKEISRIAVADESVHSISVFNTDGDLLSYCNQLGYYGRKQLSVPQGLGLAFLNKTDLAIADTANHMIHIVNTTSGVLVKSFGNKGTRNGEFCNPQGVHVDDNGNIIVSDTGNHRVQVFTKDGYYQYQFGLTKRDNFDPVSTVTHRGLFYVSDSYNHVIHVFVKEGNALTRISTIGGKGSADGQLSGPCGLAIDNDHNLLVCDRGNNRNQKFTLRGHLVGKTYVLIKDPIQVAALDDGQSLVSVGSDVLFVK